MMPPLVPDPRDDTGPRKPPPTFTGTFSDESTGFPWLWTWRAIYLFVLATFVLWILLLTALTECYS